MTSTFVAEVLPTLHDIDHRIIFELHEEVGIGASQLASIGLSLSQTKTRLRWLAREGICEFGPLFNEEGELRGSGYWLSPFGAMVRKALQRQPSGDMADMVERIRFMEPGQNIKVSAEHYQLPPIGLSGFAGSGKTEVARILTELFGYERQHIAEPLRRMLASLLQDYGYEPDQIERYLVGDLKESVIPELGVTSRHLQISLGTEWGREQVSPDLWAKLWGIQARMATGRPRMNDSVRFPNEEAPIRDLGGFTVMVNRPGLGPVKFKWRRVGPLLHRWFGLLWGAHDSERTDRLRPDVVIENDGDLLDLRKKVEEALRPLLFSL